VRERGRVARAVFGAVIVVLYAPLVFLVVSSVNANVASTSWQGFTFDWYERAFDDIALRRAFWVSVRLAIGASVLAVIVGTLAVLAFRRTRAMRAFGTALATARLSTPEIIVATGLAAALPAIGVSFGLRPMLIGHVTLLSAYVVLIVGARAAGADQRIEEAALDLGAGHWRVLRDIVLPDLRPAIVSSLLLTMAFSFDDVALSLALRGPNDTTVPIYVFSAVQRRVTPSIHALGTIVLAIGLVTFAGAALVNRALTHDRASLEETL
jgi:spermidine/putrescine transport system permease protein